MIPFVKMHGLGNDFIMLDGVSALLPQIDFPVLSRELNDRRFGIGGDGLILVERGSAAPFRMRMFNPDGSESEMCGNGIRCFGRLLRQKGYVDSERIAVETGAGVLHLGLLEDGRVQVDMGSARLERGAIPMSGLPDDTFIDQILEVDGIPYRATAVSMGNPHVVIFVDDVSDVPLTGLGPQIENHLLFPNRTNVHFAQKLGPTRLKQRTWERGAGITLACGTGACAVAVAGFLTGRSERNVDIELPGGVLSVHYKEDGHVLMTGPAETVFTGEWEKSRDELRRSA